MCREDFVRKTGGFVADLGDGHNGENVIVLLFEGGKVAASLASFVVGEKLRRVSAGIRGQGQPSCHTHQAAKLHC